MSWMPWILSVLTLNSVRLCQWRLEIHLYIHKYINIYGHVYIYVPVVLLQCYRKPQLFVHVRFLLFCLWLTHCPTFLHSFSVLFAPSSCQHSLWSVWSDGAGPRHGKVLIFFHQGCAFCLDLLVEEFKCSPLASHVPLGFLLWHSQHVPCTCPLMLWVPWRLGLKDLPLCRWLKAKIPALWWIWVHQFISSQFRACCLFKGCIFFWDFG